MSLVAIPPDVGEVAACLRSFDRPWAVAGGWALDLALGRVTRPHADVDVAVFREDQMMLRAALPGWRFAMATAGVLAPWDPVTWLELPVHEVHAQPPAGVPGGPLEFLLNERAGADWVYRRDPAVRRPLTQAVVKVAGGMPVLAPEIVLLYKSTAPRAKDEADFRVASSRLEGEARSWLRAGITRTTPGHPWAVALADEV